MNHTTKRNDVTIRCGASNPVLALEGVLAANAQAAFIRNFNAWLDLWISRGHGRNDAAFARAMQVTRTTVSGWRSGRIQPTISTLSPIAEELGIHVWQLFEDPNDGRPTPKVPIDPVEAAYRALGEKLGFKRIKLNRDS